MKVYRKDETDVIFGEWESDLAQLDTLDAIIIPRGATNGDVIKAMFPNAEIDADPYSPSVDIYVGGILMMRVDRNWWNAPYGGE